MNARVLLLVALLGTACHSLAEDKDAAIVAANKALTEGKFRDAEKQFKKLSKKDATCMPCLVGLGRAQLGLGDLNKAQDTFGEVLKRSQEKNARAAAHRFKAETFLLANDPAKAEPELRSAMTERDSPYFHFVLGVTLMRLERDEQGKEEFARFLNAPVDADAAALARKYIENPERARKPMAPDLAFRGLDGEDWSLERLRGKVVVMDFWATWCGPCRASVGELKELVKKYPSDRLVLISISADDSDKDWRKFIDKNKMNWVHYRDDDNKVLQLFNVHAFPTYMVIDGNGLIRKRLTGGDPQRSLSARIKDVLKDLPELKEEATSAAR
jgi:thiol-disulfide isomerase/thioredoxin